MFSRIRHNNYVVIKSCGIASGSVGSSKRYIISSAFGKTIEGVESFEVVGVPPENFHCHEVAGPLIERLEKERVLPAQAVSGICGTTSGTGEQTAYPRLSVPVAVKFALLQRLFLPPCELVSAAYILSRWPLVNMVEQYE